MRTLIAILIAASLFASEAEKATKESLDGYSLNMLVALSLKLQARAIAAEDTVRSLAKEKAALTGAPAPPLPPPGKDADKATKESLEGYNYNMLVGLALKLQDRSLKAEEAVKSLTKERDELTAAKAAQSTPKTDAAKPGGPPAIAVFLFGAVTVSDLKVIWTDPSAAITAKAMAVNSDSQSLTIVARLRLAKKDGAMIAECDLKGVVAAGESGDLTGQLPSMSEADWRGVASQKITLLTSTPTAK